MAYILYDVQIFIIYFLGFIVFLVIYPILAFLVMWIIGKVSPKRRFAIKRRFCIAFIPNTVLYILLVVYFSPYSSTELKSLCKAYDISLPLRYVSNVEYPPQGGDDFCEIKYIKFVADISDKAIARMDALCEDNGEMAKNTGNIVLHYPYPNTNKNIYRVGNSKNIPWGWSKKGDVYYYYSDDSCEEYYYYFSIDASTNTAVEELHCW